MKVISHLGRGKRPRTGAVAGSRLNDDLARYPLLP